MDSIIKELQIESMNSDIKLSKLLLKAYFVAKKLKIKEFEDWINLELHGYHGEGVYRYRKIRGIPKYYNPLTQSFEDFNIENQEIHDTYSFLPIDSPIGELEDLYDNSDSKKQLTYEIPQGIRAICRNHFNTSYVPEKLFILPSSFKGIFDTVRKIILDWSIKLEEDGILGEDLTFSEKEEKIAHRNQNIYYTLINESSNVQVGNGNIQNISNADLDEVKKLLISIKDSLSELKLSTENENELKIEIETIESQLKSKKPNTKILNEGLKSLRKVLEGSGATIVASGLIMGITKIIGVFSQ